MNDHIHVAETLERLGSFYFNKNDSINTISSYQKAEDGEDINKLVSLTKFWLGYLL